MHVPKVKSTGAMEKNKGSGRRKREVVRSGGEGGGYPGTYVCTCVYIWVCTQVRVCVCGWR